MLSRSFENALSMVSARSMDFTVASVPAMNFPPAVKMLFTCIFYREKTVWSRLDFFGPRWLTNKAQKGTVKSTLFAFCRKSAKKTDEGGPVLKSPKTLEFEKIILERMSNASPNDRINKLMDFSLEDCSYEDQSLTLSFPVEWWMLNSKDTMHGGLICTAFDIGMGMLSLSLVRSGHTPTMQMDVTFVRPVHVDDRCSCTRRPRASAGPYRTSRAKPVRKRPARSAQRPARFFSRQAPRLSAFENPLKRFVTLVPRRKKPRQK
jgi:acyl-coenzyme A thioesterase PaaI-like protein